MKQTIFILAALFTFIGHPSLAAEKRSHEETLRLMKKNKDVRCSFVQDFLLQTKEGGGTPDNDPPKKILFANLSPEASSPSDFAFYALNWENEDFDFYYFMNSQIGEIRIKDKKTGFSAEIDLDLSDLSKEEPYIGEVRLIRIQDVQVTDPNNTNQKVPGELYTYLTGVCHLLDDFVP